MHPFAKYIQILGKGRKGTRSLTHDEAYEAMRMINCYDVEPEQMGAFLMLMRVKEETAEEVAGFTRAFKESLPTHDKKISPSIDWAAYAGKKRQLPWFLLAALIVVRRGYPVCNHYREVWAGEAEDTYGEAAVTGTLAMVIRALGLETSEQSAHRLATVWWHERHHYDNAREAVAP